MEVVLLRTSAAGEQTTGSRSCWRRHVRGKWQAAILKAEAAGPSCGSLKQTTLSARAGGGSRFERLWQGAYRPYQGRMPPPPHDATAEVPPEARSPVFVSADGRPRRNFR